MVTVIGAAKRVWYLQQIGGSNLAPPFVTWLHQHYAIYRQIKTSQAYITEYRRLPDDLQDRYHIGTDNIHLLGWAIPAGMDVKTCEAVGVETWWQATATPAGDYEIALELTGKEGQIAAQVEAPPSFAPTSQWAAETYYLDLHTLAIPCDLPPGTYSVKVGLLDSAAPNDSSSEAPATLTTLRVSE
jgi:hypothetical protein